ncbi:MAG TPA: IS1 family transposase [Rhizomicrobium sp.]|jgi:IS1 family transposase
MVNRTPLARRTQIINCLVEGNSIRSTKRLTNTHRDTVMRLMVEVGEGCQRIMDEKMRNLPSQLIQVDEIWSYVRKKQANLRPGESVRAGDFWTFVAIDPQTKIVPSYRIGKRTRENAVAFVQDLSERLTSRVQISSDALRSYVDAVELAFGADADYGQVVKFYDKEPIGPGRYSPPRVTGTEKTVIAGNPDQAHISTSLIERQNLTMRMSMRRFTRLTNGFSKKVENLKAAVSLHFAHYNFVRMHKSLRMTPAMAAGVSDRLWSLEELVEQTSK